GDDITGLSMLPQIIDVYFSLSPGSPTLARLGLSPADILVSGENGLDIFARASTLGLSSDDQLSGLVLDAANKTALFTISSFSKHATTSGGTLNPGDVYKTTFNGSYSVFRTAADLGLLPDDELQDIATIASVPEPSTFSLLLVPAGVLLLFRGRRGSCPV